MNASAQPDRIYKVVTSDVAAAAEAAGRLAGMPVDLSDGFIHFSTAAQLGETLRRHFAGQSDLVLWAVRLAALGDSVRWEPSRGGQLFPHLYGELALAAVVERAQISVAADGSCALPDWVG